eukprot:gene49979-59898_t
MPVPLPALPPYVLPPAPQPRGAAPQWDGVWDVVHPGAAGTGTGSRVLGVWRVAHPLIFYEAAGPGSAGAVTDVRWGARSVEFSLSVGDVADGGNEGEPRLRALIEFALTDDDGTLDR